MFRRSAPADEWRRIKGSGRLLMQADTCRPSAGKEKEERTAGALAEGERPGGEFDVKGGGAVAVGAPVG
jgi:hypothetical protein